MANLKRNAEVQHQTRSKKSKSGNNKDSQESGVEGLTSTPQIEAPAMQEDDEETGSLTEVAQRVQKLTIHGAGRDPWPGEFSKRLKDDQIEVLRRLDAVRKNITSERTAFEDELITLLAAALTPFDDENKVTAPDQPLKIANFTSEHQRLYKQSMKLIARSSAVLQEYHRLSQRNLEPSRLLQLKKDFEDNKTAAASAISAGRKIAQADIGGLLADKHHEVRAQKEIDREALRYGRALLASGTQDEGGRDNVVGWGRVAYKSGKAVEKMHNIARGED